MEGILVEFAKKKEILYHSSTMTVWIRTASFCDTIMVIVFDISGGSDIQDHSPLMNECLSSLRSGPWRQCVNEFKFPGKYSFEVYICSSRN